MYNYGFQKMEGNSNHQVMKGQEYVINNNCII